MKAIWIVSIIVSAIGAVLLSNAAIAGADASGPQVALALVLVVLPYFGARVLENFSAGREIERRKSDSSKEGD